MKGKGNNECNKRNLLRKPIFNTLVSFKRREEISGVKGKERE